LDNFPSGYFRDMQIIKESFLPVFEDLKTVDIAAYAVSNMPAEDILKDDRCGLFFQWKKLTNGIAGIPFREAYKRWPGRLAKVLCP
jgi:argininosuccinate lyase